MASPYLDPSPAQIRTRCLEIQSTWTVDERQKRLAGCVHWSEATSYFGDGLSVENSDSILQYFATTGVTQYPRS